MSGEIYKFLAMLKEEDIAFIIPNEKCRKAMGIAITEMSKHNKNFVNILNHTFRVAGMSTHLAQRKKESAIIKEICFLSAIFHDVFKEEDEHEVKGGNFAKKILTSLKYKYDVVEKVVASITTHNEGKKILHTIEAKILWDADKLDKIGAMAFLRRTNETNLKRRLEKDKNVFLYLDCSKEIYRKKVENMNKCLSAKTNKKTL